MSQAMVTGRMDEEKKARGASILKRDGLNPSQAINLLYDRIIADGNASVLSPGRPAPNEDRWQSAARFVDSLSEAHTSRFDNMTKGEIRAERLKNRGLM